MAKFTPPFSTDGENRLPTSDEQEQGFACGPADRRLFGGLFRRIEAELQAIQDAGGITGDDTDDTTVLQAIQALISAATGGGDTSQFVLFSQARARLPIFPEILMSDGRIGLTTPATGQIRIPGNVGFLHRGIFLVNTIQTDIATTASKTYHLRWNATEGFKLRDLADLSYNAGVASESSAVFDSTYDDMLVARIVTNAANVCTITNLANKDRLFLSKQNIIAPVRTGTGHYTVTSAETLNWARTPKIMAIRGNVAAGQPNPTGGMDGHAGYLTSMAVNRYSASGTASTDWVTAETNGSMLGYMHFDLGA